MTTTTIDPVAIDTQIAEFNAIINAAFERSEKAAVSARQMLGERKVQIGRSRGYLSTDTEALDRLKATDFTSGLDIDRKARIIATVAAANSTIGEALEQRAPLDALYAAQQWTRYSEVVGGHIHQGTYCAGGTIRRTTRIGWRVDLSGTEIAAAVAELGPTLCSHCFPSAPLEWRRSAEEVKAEAEAAAGIYCGSKHLSQAERDSVDSWNRMTVYVDCEACGANAVSLTSTRLKRKHKRPAA